MAELYGEVSVEALALSPTESRAYPRWYADLLLRKHTEAVAIGDVLHFVSNFGLTQQEKQKIVHLFGAPLVTLEPAQFYTFLRLAAHLQQGKTLRRELAFVAAPVPRPKSIMAKRKHAASNRSVSTSAPADMDSFMSLMTGKPSSGTGSGSGVGRKRVTFDSSPPQVAEAAHRSMGELLRQRQIYQPIPPPPPPQNNQEQQEDDQEPEPELPHNQFAKVNIDSVLYHGTSTVPPTPPPRKTAGNAGDSFIKDLVGQPQEGLAQRSLQSQGTGPLQSQGTGSSQLHNAGSGLQAQGTGPQWPQLRAQTSGQSQSTAHIQPQPNNPGLQPQGTGSQSQQLRAQSTGPSQNSGRVQSQNTGPAPQAPGTGSQWPPLHLPNTGLLQQSLGQIPPQGTGPLQSQNTGLMQNLGSGLQPQQTAPTFQIPHSGYQSNSPAMQQQLGSGQVPLSQSTGLTPQGTGFQPLLLAPTQSYNQPQFPGQQMLSPNPTGYSPQHLSPMTTPNGMLSSFGQQLTPQLTPQHQAQYQPQFQPAQQQFQPVPQQFGQQQYQTLPQQYAVPQQQMQPAQHLQMHPQMSGIQYVNGGTNQHQSGQAFQMQGLRDQVPRWG